MFFFSNHMIMSKTFFSGYNRTYRRTYFRINAININNCKNKEKLTRRRLKQSLFVVHSGRFHRALDKILLLMIFQTRGHTTLTLLQDICRCYRNSEVSRFAPFRIYFSNVTILLLNIRNRIEGNA